jgi:hypothetical protein
MAERGLPLYPGSRDSRNHAYAILDAALPGSRALRGLRFPAGPAPGYEPSILPHPGPGSNAHPSRRTTRPGKLALSGRPSNQHNSFPTKNLDPRLALFRAHAHLLSPLLCGSAPVCLCPSSPANWLRSAHRCACLMAAPFCPMPSLPQLALFRAHDHLPCLSALRLRPSAPSPLWQGAFILRQSHKDHEILQTRHSRICPLWLRASV